MKKSVLSKIPKTLLYLLSAWFVIMITALGIFIFHKINSICDEYVADDFIVSAGELTEDLAAIDDTAAYSGTFVTVPMALSKGSYRVDLHYLSTATGNRADIGVSGISNLHFRSNPVSLSPQTGDTTLYLELDRPCDEVTINVSYGGAGMLELYQINVTETTDYYKRGLIYALALCMVIGMIYYFYRSSAPKRKTLFLLGAIWGASCIPLLTDYLIVGHDLPFHLLRIDGIYHSLRQGVFPVKIDPVWAKDYGYAVSVFYGNALLYLPALLRFFGFTVQSAYKIYVLLINLGTVLVSYYSFKTIFRSDKAGIWGSLLYSLSIYRLSDLYIRAAVGEYSALMFLPLVLCGFCVLFTEMPRTRRQELGPIFMIALGLTGIIQTHVLTCEMLVLPILLLCIVQYKKVLQKGTFLSLTTAALTTLTLNLGFLIPFLDYYSTDINIRSEEWGAGAFKLIQGKGMFPAQLLSFLPQYTGGSWDTVSGVATEATYAPGIILLLFLVIFGYKILCEKQDISNPELIRLGKPAVFCSILALLSLWMSSCYFPYDTLSSLGKIPETLISSLQFPWRFLAPATVLLVFVAVYTIQLLSESASAQQGVMLIIGGLLLLFAVNVGWLFKDYIYTGTPYRVYQTGDLDSMAMYSYEYLPAGTDPGLILEGRVATIGCSFSEYRKEGTTVYMTLAADGSEACVEVPLNYYKYYTCKDLTGDSQFKVAPGYNNTVRVDLPTDYMGQIKIYFREPVHWRIGELISLFTFIGIITAAAYYKRRG